MIGQMWRWIWCTTYSKYWKKLPIDTLNSLLNCLCCQLQTRNITFQWLLLVFFSYNCISEPQKRACMVQIPYYANWWQPLLNLDYWNIGTIERKSWRVLKFIFLTWMLCLTCSSTTLPADLPTSILWLLENFWHWSSEALTPRLPGPWRAVQRHQTRQYSKALPGPREDPSHPSITPLCHQLRTHWALESHYSYSKLGKSTPESFVKSTI